MKKKKNPYKCKECGYESIGYLGKCPSCGTWNSFEEVQEVEVDLKAKTRLKTKAQPLGQGKFVETKRYETDISEFNRVLGGGVVRDSVSILTAKPGAGKSTLLLQVCQDFASHGLKVLYASGEESQSQIYARARRILENISDKLWVVSSNSLDQVLAEVASIDPDVLVLDSIQTFQSSEYTSRPGSPTQTMACANEMVSLAKGDRPRMVFIVGQMTKEDELAGVRSLEHLVDTVLMIEGDSGDPLRTLYTTKNRFGSTGEMGFFEMTEKGLRSIDNPSRYFMTDRKPGFELPGSALTVLREGTRPIVVEIEALVNRSFTPYPMRIGECIKREHLQTLISILEERGKQRLMDKNIVVKTTGNIPLRETAANLALIMSVYSSLTNKALPSKTLFLADVGLTGELKAIPNLEARILEGRRLGFEEIITGPVAESLKEKYDLKTPHTLSEVLKNF